MREYNMSKIHLANGPSHVDRDEGNFLPRTDFHGVAGQSGKRICGSLEALKQRSSLANQRPARHLWIHEWPSVRLIQATREISFSRTRTTRDRLYPSSFLCLSLFLSLRLSVLELVKLTRVLLIITIYIANCPISFSNKRLRRIAM